MHRGDPIDCSFCRSYSSFHLRVALNIASCGPCINPADAWWPVLARRGCGQCPGVHASRPKSGQSFFWPGRPTCRRGFSHSDAKEPQTRTLGGHRGHISTRRPPREKREKFDKENCDGGTHNESCRGEADFRITRLLHSVVQEHDHIRIQAVPKLVHQLEAHPNKEALQADLKQHRAFNPFSEQSQEMIYSVGNMENFDFCEMTPKIQCTNNVT